MEEIMHIVKHTIEHGIRLLPFLFVAYLVMEFIEHKTGEKAKTIIKKSGKFGPLLGSVLGIFPQCGFSAAASNLYAGRIITLGTLIAIFLSTSDEMLPILISANAPMQTILLILGIKVLIGIVAGFVIDLVIELYNKKIVNKKQEKKDIELEQEIGHMCEHEHCHCDEGGVLKSAIKHTLSIFVFILIITFIINMLIELIGQDNLANLVLNKPVIGPIISGFLGLIPNCAGSVVLTQLYLEQVISLGSMIGGLLVGSGIGILILFRVNKNLKENLKILGLLYAIGIICGIIIDLIV